MTVEPLDLNVFGGWLVAILIAVFGWIRSSRTQETQLQKEAEQQRVLLRKQTALQLLSDSRFNDNWIAALTATSAAVHASNTARKSLKEMAERYYSNKETDE